MVSINLELNKDGHFFDDTVADPPIVEEIKSNKMKVNVSYNNNLMRSNINILLQHLLLQPYATAKFKLVQIFKNAESNESRLVLKEFSQNISNKLYIVLYYAHLLFWQNPGTHVRSPYEFDDILKESIELGIKEIELTNKINGMRSNYSIQSIILNNQLKQNVKNNVKRLGYNYDKNSK